MGAQINSFQIMDSVSRKKLFSLSGDLGGCCVAVSPALGVMVMDCGRKLAVVGICPETLSFVDSAWGLVEPPETTMPLQRTCSLAFCGNDPVVVVVDGGSVLKYGMTWMGAHLFFGGEKHQSPQAFLVNVRTGALVGQLLDPGLSSKLHPRTALVSRDGSKVFLSFRGLDWNPCAVRMYDRATCSVLAEIALPSIPEPQFWVSSFVHMCWTEADKRLVVMPCVVTLASLVFVRVSGDDLLVHDRATDEVDSASTAVAKVRSLEAMAKESGNDLHLTAFVASDVMTGCCFRSRNNNVLVTAFPFHKAPCGEVLMGSLGKLVSGCGMCVSGKHLFLRLEDEVHVMTVDTMPLRMLWAAACLGEP